MWYSFTMKNLVLLSVLFFVSSVSADTSSKSSTSYKVVCYFGSWANYRQGDGKFVVEDIDPHLCTHLIYAFTKLSPDNGITVHDAYLSLEENWGLGTYQRFNNLRQRNPSLKTLIAMGGWDESSSKYSQMAANYTNRKTFVDNCVNFLKEHGFDGLDLNWKYPANRGGKPEDKQNFVSLLEELKEAFQPHGFLLSAAVSAGKRVIDTAYDIPAISKNLDFINLMAYDFHGGWDKVTAHHAPLYPGPNDLDKTFNVDFAVKYWLSKGCPPDKLILGMPLYGRGVTLQDPKRHGLDAPASGNGMAGPYSGEEGMMGYNEICNKLTNETGWTTVFEPTIQAPYAFKDKQWFGYDNEKSIGLKVEYLQKMNLGGGMVWSIEHDDFRGLCYGQKYPLLRTISEALVKGGEDTTKPAREFTFRPTVPTPKLTTSNEMEDTLPCPYSGFFRHPSDCKRFYFCQPSGAGNKETKYDMFRCDEGTVFSQKMQMCTYPRSVPECS